MSRISYTTRGFLRRVQMSRDSIFLIVEGRNHDRIFYDRICHSSEVLRSAGYQIWLSEQASDGHGGKQAMLKMFDYCRRSSNLAFQNQTSVTGRTALIFCLDRDGDHVSGGMKRSPHVVYTRSADVENEIFTEGRDVDALATALSLDKAAAESLLTRIGDWRNILSTLLRSWIELCALAQKLSAHVGGIGWASNSAVNGSSNFDEIDAVAVAKQRSKILAKSQFDADSSLERERQVLKRIDREYRLGRGWELVKGKWVPRFLERSVCQALGDQPADLKHFRLVVTKLYLSNIDFSAAWSQHYRQAFETHVTSAMNTPSDLGSRPGGS